MNNHWWFTFSIYAIETNDFKSSTIVKFLAPSSLPPRVSSARGSDETKVATKAIPLENRISELEPITSVRGAQRHHTPSLAKLESARAATF
jgi:hypothetical protein